MAPAFPNAFGGHWRHKLSKEAKNSFSASFLPDSYLHYKLRHFAPCQSFTSPKPKYCHL